MNLFILVSDILYQLSLWPSWLCWQLHRFSKQCI